MKSERGYYTIYTATAFSREEHATTSDAAIRKACKMFERLKRVHTVFITVDRGRGKTASKVFCYGRILRHPDGGYAFVKA
ncbi:MAG: hypothetical protein LUG50_06880 [Planctomycetaceae bacterium]|nr:hypothetical protein [Planctomycetaceae bacterium]